MVYCGQTVPNSFFSKDSNVTIQFFSDATISSLGFRLVWNTVPGTVRLKFALDIFIIFIYLYCKLEVNIRVVASRVGVVFLGVLESESQVGLHNPG